MNIKTYRYKSVLPNAFWWETKKEGITADISLEADRLNVTFGVDIYVWIPVVDQMAPTQDQLSFGAESIQKLVTQGRKAYVHCRNGHGHLSLGHPNSNGLAET